MTGKEKFKAVKKEYIEGIMTEYSVDKDKAYSTLADVLNESIVSDTISAMVAEKLTELKIESSTKQFLDEYFKIR